MWQPKRGMLICFRLHGPCEVMLKTPPSTRLTSQKPSSRRLLAVFFLFFLFFFGGGGDLDVGSLCVRRLSVDLFFRTRQVLGLNRCRMTAVTEPVSIAVTIWPDLLFQALAWIAS